MKPNTQQEERGRTAEQRGALTERARKEIERILKEARKAGYRTSNSIAIDKKFSAEDIRALASWKETITVESSLSTKNNKETYDVELSVDLDFTRASQEQKDALVETKGNVTDGSPTPRFSRLGQVGGELRLYGAEAISQEQFPKLYRIAGGLSAYQATSIDMRVIEIGGAILTDKQKILSLNFPELVKLMCKKEKDGYDTVAVDGYQINKAHFPKLARVEGDIRLAHCRDWNFDSLEIITGTLGLSGDYNDPRGIHLESDVQALEVAQGKKFSRAEREQKREEIRAKNKTRIARLPNLKEAGLINLGQATHIELPSLEMAGSLHANEALKLLISLQHGRQITIGVLWLNGLRKSGPFTSEEERNANDKIVEELQGYIDSGKLVVNTIIKTEAEAQQYFARHKKAA